ncbi:nuclear body protein SP140-like protein [Molossus molossus]|uniref:SP140 nuclear body protein like n=1 Tax=Molossus molossus TaxID=27622 RepID=A0A7J8FU34_MOLMO|nr:nuclear body protein SP140-like protein [Molossus molossus]KAF6451166.1 hypothetical protein HJG59_017195 [Molossus molossus]
MDHGGSDPSTRMSSENKRICDIALSLFKKYKVAISDAINTTFPFLECLRDHGFITNEIYKESEESFKMSDSKQRVIYKVLNEVEKTFDLSFLGTLFSDVIMKKYPGLNRIYKMFTKVIPDLDLHLEKDEKEEEDRPDGLEQVNISEDSTESNDGDKLPKACTSALKRSMGTVDLGNSSALEKTKKKKRTKHSTNKSVNFHDEILPVTCGKSSGMLIKRKLERGVTMKCIRSDDGNWFSLRELEIRGGYENANNWKNSLRCDGIPLKKLIMEGTLPPPPRAAGRGKAENSEKCRICQDEGKLYCCIACLGFFHGNCHLPPVESERNPWRCTFCTIQMGPKSQKYYKESEILGRLMGSEEKLKCDFILLKVYQQLESNVFPNIPHENYFEQASRCLKKLRMLDNIKKNLIEGQYQQVEVFVRDMNHIFQDPRCNDTDLTEDEFKKDFKAVFAIQKPNLNSSLL